MKFDCPDSLYSTISHWEHFNQSLDFGWASLYWLWTLWISYEYFLGMFSIFRHNTFRSKFPLIMNTTTRQRETHSINSAHCIWLLNSNTLVYVLWCDGAAEHIHRNSVSCMLNRAQRRRCLRDNGVLQKTNVDLCGSLFCMSPMDWG